MVTLGGHAATTSSMSRRKSVDNVPNVPLPSLSSKIRFGAAASAVRTSAAKKMKNENGCVDSFMR